MKILFLFQITSANFHYYWVLVSSSPFQINNQLYRSLPLLGCLVPFVTSYNYCFGWNAVIQLAKTEVFTSGGS